MTPRAEPAVDPREVLNTREMSRLQIIVVAITVALNALDGFDVLSISFASPGIAQEWRIDRAALGVVLSMELLGMALGSILLGGVADRIGRRRTLLGCLVLMSAGMFLATTASDVYALSAWRVLTGLGIGGMLAAINAVAAEFANARSRGLAISLMAIGYPLGAVVGGSIAAMFLRGGNWRGVFLFGAAATAALIPLVYWLVPESVHWLCQRQPEGALARVNAALARMRREPVEALPPRPEAARPTGVRDLFAKDLGVVTILLTLAYFLHVTAFYFIIKWVPKIVVDMGFTAASAAGVLVAANIGGATGGAIFGLLSRRFGLKTLTIAVLAMSTVMLAVFGRERADLTDLAIVCAVTGFFTNSGIVGLYGMVAAAFPTRLRASGTGFVVGFGRGGAVFGPIAAGWLFHSGFSLPIVATAIGVGPLIAAAAIWLLPARTGFARG